jgi:hypothetical protein
MTRVATYAKLVTEEVGVMSVALHEPRMQKSLRAPGGRPLGGHARRFGLGIFFASVVVNAALGVYAVLAPHFGETQVKILGTSLCVTGAVLLALACEPAWERQLLEPVPLLAAALGTIGFALAIVLIWAQPASEAWAKVMNTVFAFSFAGVAASLLALARLAPRHGWVFRVNLGLLGVAAAMFATMPWLDRPPDWFARVYGVVMIVLAAFVATVPVLHWVDRGALAQAEAAPGKVSFCPYCGRRLEGEAGVDLTCGRCGRRFSVIPANGAAPRPST